MGSECINTCYKLNVVPHCSRTAEKRQQTAGENGRTESAWNSRTAHKDRNADWTRKAENRLWLCVWHWSDPQRFNCYRRVYGTYSYHKRWRNGNHAEQFVLGHSRNGFKVVSGRKPQTETHGLCAIYAEYSFRLRRRNNRIFHDIYWTAWRRQLPDIFSVLSPWTPTPSVKTTEGIFIPKIKKGR